MDNAEQKIELKAVAHLVSAFVSAIQEANSMQDSIPSGGFPPESTDPDSYSEADLNRFAAYLEKRGLAVTLFEQDLAVK